MSAAAREKLARLLFMADNHNADDPAHEWEILTRHAPSQLQHYYEMADAAIAAGYVQAAPGTASRDDVLEEAATTLETAIEYGGAYGQRARRPSNFTRAAKYVRDLKGRQPQTEKIEPAAPPHERTPTP